LAMENVRGGTFASTSPRSSLCHSLPINLSSQRHSTSGCEPRSLASHVVPDFPWPTTKKTVGRPSRNRPADPPLPPPTVVPRPGLLGPPGSDERPDAPASGAGGKWAPSRRRIFMLANVWDRASARSPASLNYGETSTKGCPTQPRREANRPDDLRRRLLPRNPIDSPAPRSVPLGLQYALDGAVLLFLEDLVPVGRVVQRHGVRLEVLDA
jgi:hypothetical protein